MLVWRDPSVASGGCRVAGVEHRRTRRRTRRTNAGAYARGAIALAECATRDQRSALAQRDDIAEPHCRDDADADIDGNAANADCSAG
jgi:type II secretory pathway component PulK